MIARQTSRENNKKDKFPVWAIILLSVLGFVVFCAIIITIILYYKFEEWEIPSAEDPENLDDRPATENNYDDWKELIEVQPEINHVTLSRDNNTVYAKDVSGQDYYLLSGSNRWLKNRPEPQIPGKGFNEPSTRYDNDDKWLIEDFDGTITYYDDKKLLDMRNESVGH